MKILEKVSMDLVTEEGLLIAMTLLESSLQATKIEEVIIMVSHLIG